VCRRAARSQRTELAWQAAGAVAVVLLLASVM